MAGAIDIAWLVGWLGALATLVVALRLRRRLAAPRRLIAGAVLVAFGALPNLAILVLGAGRL